MRAARILPGVLTALLVAAVVEAQIPPPIFKPKLTLPVQFSKVTIRDLGVLRQLKISQVKQAEFYANMANHGAAPPTTPPAHPAVAPRTINGITYRLQTVPFSEEPATTSIGSALTETSTDHKRICTVVPSRQTRFISAIREYGTPPLAPGMIFTAQSVLDGTFQQMNVTRRAFNITTGLVDYSAPLDQNRPVKAVAAPYNLGSINTALANLQNQLGAVTFPDQFFGEVFSLHTAASAKLDFKAKATADLGALAGIPASVSAGSGFSNTSSLDFERVAAIIENPYYTVSIAEQPWELVDGTAPNNAVVLQSVVYGRLAIFKSQSKVGASSLATSVTAAVDALEGGASASTEFNSLFTSSSNETSCQVTIVGGPPNTGVNSLDSFQDFKDALQLLSPTVAGGFGVPIAYVFRYLSDDAPVLIQGTADYGVVDCTPLTRLKVSGLIAPSFVDDFPPDEELYGSITMTVAGKEKTLWSKGSSTFVKLSTNQALPFPDGALANWNSNISSGEEVTFDVPSAEIDGGSAKVTFAMKDRIESGPEFLGATDVAKEKGFVTYSPGTKSIALRDVLESQGKKKEVQYFLDEAGVGKGQIKAVVRLRFPD